MQANIYQSVQIMGGGQKEAAVKITNDNGAQLLVGVRKSVEAGASIVDFPCRAFQWE